MPGVVKLVEAVISDGWRWLLLNPVGSELPGEPASTVLRHIGELAQTVEDLARYIRSRVECRLLDAYSFAVLWPYLHCYGFEAQYCQ